METVDLHVGAITELAISQVSADIRRNDRDEIEAAYGVDCDIAPILHAQIEETANHYALYHQGKAIALFGCHPVATVLEDEVANVGCPWLIGTRKLGKLSPMFLHRAACTWLEVWLEQFRYLKNTVWGDSPSIDWLRRLGFYISDTPSMTVPHTEEDFYTFFRGAE